MCVFQKVVHASHPSLPIIIPLCLTEHFILVILPTSRTLHLYDLERGAFYEQGPLRIITLDLIVPIMPICAENVLELFHFLAWCLKLN